jgi:N-methylhydantoinase B/oxoprolinase/acetone carboxylase alpha subunit
MTRQGGDGSRPAPVVAWKTELSGRAQEARLHCSGQVRNIVNSNPTSRSELDENLS